MVSFAISIFISQQMWDARKKGCLNTFQCTYQVTAATFNDTAEQIICGGIDNELKVTAFKNMFWTQVETNYVVSYFSLIYIAIPFHPLN